MTQIFWIIAAARQGLRAKGSAAPGSDVSDFRGCS
jgi:hypothetical protein